MTPESWDNFRKPFEASGYKTHAPSWPLIPFLAARRRPQRCSETYPYCRNLGKSRSRTFVGLQALAGTLSSSVVPAKPGPQTRIVPISNGKTFNTEAPGSFSLPSRKNLSHDEGPIEIEGRANG
jgi:hypothetical protein